MKKLLTSVLLVLVFSATYAQITIVTPTTGQTTVIGQSLTVYYTSPTYVSMGMIEVYKGATKVYTHTSAYQSTNHNIPTGSFAAGTDYRVKIYDASNPSYNSWSGYFSIVASPPVPTVAYPTSVAATSFIANWNSAAGATGYRIDISTDNFVTMLSGYSNLLVTGTSVIVSGTQPNIIYQYRVRTVIGAAVSANSTAMKAGFLKDWITAPNGGNAFFSEDFIYVQVDYALNPGYSGLFCELYDGATRVFPPAGSSPFSSQSLPTSGFVPGDNYKVRVWDASNPTLEDWSDEPFSILPVSRRMNAVNVEDIAIPGLKTVGTVRGANIGEKSSTADFFDGLGRKVQRIEKQASPGNHDIVQPVVYDLYDRITTEYLSYASDQKHGWYITNPVGLPGSYTGSAHQQYYANGVSDKVADDLAPYSITVLESSPLNRVLKRYDPGASWHAAASNKFIQFDYLTNIHGTGTSLTQEAIIAWEVNGSGGLIRSTALAGSITSTGHYLSGMLAIDETTDEHGYRIRQYTNRSGKVVLKKAQVSSAITNLNDPLQWAFTYYVYDKYGNLTYVLQPELSRLVSPTSDTAVPDQPTIDNWAFQYKYDDRYRLTEKKVPGADVVYMVYDNRDRLVLTQNGNQRAGATNTIKYWTFTKYDELNRPILTGIKDTTTTVQLTQAQMQAAVDAHYAKAWTKYGETYLGNVAGNVHGYSNKSYPVFTTAGTLDINKYLTVTYYDNYSFRSLWTGSYTYVDENLSETVNGITYNQPDAEFAFIKGQVTGTKVKVLDGGSNWLKSITYYDDDYRAVQTIADNQTGGTDLTTTVYDFTGKPLETKTTHRALWRDRIGVSVSANTITKTAVSTTWGTAGTASVRALPASTNGYIEFMVNDLTSTRMIGFALANENADYKTIDFIVYLNNATLYAYERDVSRGSKGSIAVGDVIRLDRTGTSMKIYKNGTVIYTFPTASSTALYADCSLGSIGSALTGIILSWAPETHTVTRRFTYDHAGRLINTWHTLDSGPEILLTKNVYNELGQLIDKKLHSTLADGSDAKQSVDYRYNIRGWMTKINESDLTTSTESGEARDLFGMELGYNTDMGISNTPLYNGNISGIKWSNNLSLGTVTENAYTYSYDAMNRITASAYKQKESTWAAAANNGFAETGFTYDLNGNIKTLQRNDQRVSGWMDNLTYNYGTGTTQSNKLLSVTDAGDDFKGFIEGTNGAGINDYTYDANGNMITDLNKGILTNLPIIYNYLNLPETVSKGTSTIRYVYDATGRKLSQTVAVTGPQKQTDYIGEYVYTNGALQFVGHEEGRIVLASEEKIFSFDGSSQTNISKSGTDVTMTNETTNGETYLKASITAGATKRGITALTTAIPVTAGERYVYRVRGYRGGEAAALYVKGNSTDLVWAGASLPNGSNIEAWVETYFTIPAGVTQIETGVLLNSSTTATHVYYINAAELIKLSTNAPEYQYHLKDHLGNVRMTFTTKQQTETYTATFEMGSATAEDADFSPSYDNVTFSSAAVYASSGTRSQRLSASPTEMVGLSKSLSVMPGDTIDMRVYAKYFTPTSTNSTVTTSTLAAAIASGFGLSPTSTGEALKAYTSINQMFTAGGMMIGPGEWEDDNAPKAYLNFILFDKDFIPYDMGWDQIAIEALENGTDVDHDLLELSAVVREPGYIYIYLSNENNKIVDVYFDDLTIEHHLGPVVQQDDYYAFGLNFNSYTRENATKNNYLYNGKEQQDELDLGWTDYGPRMYMSDLGRFNRIDIFSELSSSSSGYGYAGNDPVGAIDLGGNFEFPAAFRLKYPRVTAYLEKVLPQLQNNTSIVNSLSKHNFLDKDVVKSDFQNGQGPKVSAGDFEIPHWGNTYQKGEVLVNAEGLLQLLENGLATNDPKYQEFTEVYKFMTIVTILHEYVHEGSKRTNKRLPRGLGGRDEGSNWEYEAFGRFIDYPTKSMAQDYDKYPDKATHNTSQAYRGDAPVTFYLIINGGSSSTGGEEKKKNKIRPDGEKKRLKTTGGG